MTTHTMATGPAPVRRAWRPAAGDATRTIRRILHPPAPHSERAAPRGVEQGVKALSGAGRPLPASERAFFEPRFGRDLSAVRVHTGPAAHALTQSVQARAFTLGDSIVLGTGAGAGDRRLMAHELTHVAQQERDAGGPVIRRQTIHTSCAGHEDLLRESWAQGQRLARETAETLESIREGLGLGVPAAPSVARLIRGTFGDIGFSPGDLTFVPDLAGRFRRIESGFSAGRTLRCDAEEATVDHDECDSFDAFVITGNRTDIFLCPSFFTSERSAVSRGVTLLHEMAHGVFGIDHQGGVFPVFGCDTDLGLEYDDAKRNAYAYHILANCLHGEGMSEGEHVTGTVPAPARTATDPRWSFSASAGAELRPDVERFAGVLSGRYSLRSGQLVVFNPVIGLNALYLPPGAGPDHLAAATLEAGLRIQQPVHGVYFDVTGGPMAGFTVDPSGSTRATAGVAGSVGLGWRWERIELGAEARGLLPLTEGDRGSVLVLGRIGFRLGSGR